MIAPREGARVVSSGTGARGIPLGYAVLAASYVLAAGSLFWVLRRLARAPMELEAATEPESEGV